MWEFEHLTTDLLFGKTAGMDRQLANPQQWRR